MATGTAVNALTVIAQNDDAVGLQSEIVTQVTAGTRYQIAVDGFQDATGSISLNLAFEAGGGGGKSNDQFAGRIALGSSSVITTAGTNVGFTGQAGEPAQSGAIQSAWWQWTAPANGTLTVDTVGSPFDTFLTVATGTAVNALTVIAQNDDAVGLQSRIVTKVVAGTRYQIAVDGFLGTTGSINLNLVFQTDSLTVGKEPGDKLSFADPTKKKEGRDAKQE